MLNLENLKVVEKAYTKKSTSGQPREQHYELYFQRANRKSANGVIVTENFIFSNKLFTQLGLDNGNGLVAIDSGNSTLFGVVAEEQAMFFKGRETKGVRQEKGQAFKSDVVSGFLVRDGVINGDSIGNTFLKLELVPDSVGFVHPASGIVFVGGIYQVVADPNGEIRMGNASITKEADDVPQTPSYDEEL